LTRVNVNIQLLSFIHPSQCLDYVFPWLVMQIKGREDPSVSQGSRSLPEIDSREGLLWLTVKKMTCQIRWGILAKQQWVT